MFIKYLYYVNQPVHIIHLVPVQRLHFLSTIPPFSLFFQDIQHKWLRKSIIPFFLLSFSPKMRNLFLLYVNLLHEITMMLTCQCKIFCCCHLECMKHNQQHSGGSKSHPSQCFSMPKEGWLQTAPWHPSAISRSLLGSSSN